MNTEAIPDLLLNVEDQLMHCLSLEVSSYKVSVHGKKCLLCPFRSFTELRHLKQHLKYHCKENMIMADRRSPQISVIKAYFDYCQAGSPIEKKYEHPTHNLLKYSASLIAKWNNNCSVSTMNTLQRHNRLVLFRVLTHIGPQYWVKELTEDCIKHSREI